MNRTKLVLMAAMDELGGVGLDGKIPWKLPTDLKRFQSITLGGIVVMGGKTFAECGVLPSRTNIVLTHTMKKDNTLLEFRHDFKGKGLAPDTCLLFAPSLCTALAAFHSREPLFICGGNRVWSEAFELIARYNVEAMALLTKLKGIYGCDTFFPLYEMRNWISLMETQMQIENGHESQFSIFNRPQRASMMQDGSQINLLGFQKGEGL